MYVAKGSVYIEDIDSGEIIPCSWHSQISAPLPSVSRLKGDKGRKLAKLHRSNLSKYFIEEGAVPWQWNAVRINSVDSCITIAETNNYESDPDDPDIVDEFDDESMDEYMMKNLSRMTIETLILFNQYMCII